MLKLIIHALLLIINMLIHYESYPTYMALNDYLFVSECKKKLDFYLDSVELTLEAIKDSGILDHIQQTDTIQNLISLDNPEIAEQARKYLNIIVNHENSNCYHYRNGRIVGGESGTRIANNFSLSEKIILDAIVMKIKMDFNLASEPNADLSNEELVKQEAERNAKLDNISQILIKTISVDLSKIKQKINSLKDKAVNPQSKWTLLAVLEAIIAIICHFIISLCACVRRDAQVVPS